MALMNQIEHAQLIYAHLLQAWVASGRGLTDPDVMGLHVQALLNAKAFAKKAEEMK